MADRGAEGVGGSVLYVCGPMSGYPEHNYPAFHAAELALDRAGHGVQNPAALGVVEGWGWTDYMRRALRQVLDADGVAVLPGWQESAGASLEVHVAHALRMPVLAVDRWV